MQIQHALAAVALVFGVALTAPAPAPASAADQEDAQLEAFRQEFEAGMAAYKAGRPAEGLRQMERAAVPLMIAETRGVQALPESFSEKEARGFQMSLAFGGLNGWRKGLISIYLRHGCYGKALDLAERDLFLLDKVPEAHGGEKMRMSYLYRDTLRYLRAANQGLGRLDRAIEIQDRVVRADRAYGRRRHVAAQGLLDLALLHRDAGDLAAARGFAGEARAAYEAEWSEQPPHERRKRWIEIRLRAAEGDQEAERADLEQRLAQAREAGTLDKQGRIFGYTSLAEVYDDLGEIEKRDGALAEALPPLLDPAPVTSENLPGVARRAAALLRKAGRTAEAEKLAEAYRLCP